MFWAARILIWLVALSTAFTAGMVFHARIAEERDPGWTIDDVAGGIVDKLVARHPHVFGDATADSAAHVEARWDELKRVEKGRTSAVDGVPLGQPAL